MISGLTKAWIGTQTNGTKEVSFSDHTHSGYALSSHTHTASQVSGVLKASYGIVGSGTYTFNVNFYPVCIILLYGYSSGGNARSDVCGSIRPSSDVLGVTVSTSYRADPLPGVLIGNITWSDSSVTLSNVSIANMQYIIFGT